METLTSRRVDEALASLYATGPTRDGLRKVEDALVEMFDTLERFVAGDQSETVND